MKDVELMGWGWASWAWASWTWASSLRRLIRRTLNALALVHSSY